MTKIYYIPLTLIVILQFFLVFSPFIKYPIFPKDPSADFQSHFLNAQLFVNGGEFRFLYSGVYLLFSPLFLFFNEPITIFMGMQGIMATLTLFTPVVLFFIINKIYSNETVALLGTLIYVIVGSLWYIPIHSAGLYPNFFGNLITLLLILLLLDFVKNKIDVKRAVVFVVLILLLYNSHYSVVLILLTLLIFAPFVFKFQRRIFYTSIISILPLFGGLALIPEQASAVYSSLTTTVPVESLKYGYGGLNPLPELLGLVPFWQYLTAQVHGFVIGLLTIITIPVSIFLYIKTRNKLLLLPLIWFFVSWILAPWDAGAWRFSHQAMLPLFLLLPSIFVFLLKLKRKFWIILLLILIIPGSWSQFVVSDTSRDAIPNSILQSEIVDSFSWIRNGIPEGSRIISITDWRYYFYLPLIGKYCEQIDFLPLNQVKNDTYVIVTTMLITEPTKEETEIVKEYLGVTLPIMRYASDHVKIYRIRWV